jgi:coenzyme F420-reducing hydrogenase gamma subunit
LKYLGITPKRPKIGVFDFTCCEGCELQLTNKEDTLVDFLSLVEVVNFREATSVKGDNYDIALIEGAVSRSDEVERLKKIRTRAKVLVALGTCACFGGVNVLKNRYSIKDVVRQVYGKQRVETAKVKKISDVVKVDLAIPGCPVSKAEVEKIIVNIVTGAEIKFPKYPVCLECKQHINTCLFDLGQLCLGPITQAGCDAVCTTGKTGCLGCRGPADDANFESFKQITKEKGFTAEQVKERLDFYNAFVGI